MESPGVTGHDVYSNCMSESTPSLSGENHRIEVASARSEVPQGDYKSLILKGLHWEQKACGLLAKHFGFSFLKDFQKEAIETWLAHRDCLVLAATGSGKSLCFQLPALLSGKVVVVISPLISLMRDQCLKLVKHGVSACFLGSGQPDSTIEKKAMSGMYDLIYVCPETVLRLVDPLQRLVENRGIALFAIDEAHCISKWGHDFRPAYRHLSFLREKFRACCLKFLEFDIPLMALTATATVPVREDIIQSLQMTEEPKIVLTSFFRPNLRFSVKNSRTSSTFSYRKDFADLIKTYTMSWSKDTVQAASSLNYTANDDLKHLETSELGKFDAEEVSSEEQDFGDHYNDSSATNVNLCDRDPREMTVEFLEDELEIHQRFDDLDDSCGEYCVDFSHERQGNLPPSDSGLLAELDDVAQGSTIIYVPTRKETLKIADFLCKSGLKAAAYHAMLPKSHLRRVHEEFHRNILEVVVATVAFGMGIDKSNVRRIIHYGWPQSLEAYYQEAGRAGRDGKISDCILYANMSRIPTLLPSRRNEEQTKHAYKMLSDCFRYGMNTASCRTKKLVNYFGEDFRQDKCHLCDICVNGAPELKNLEEEAKTFMQVLLAQSQTMSSFGSRETTFLTIDDQCVHSGGKISPGTLFRSSEQPCFRMVISGIKKKFEKFSSSDQRWWQGLARILKDKGYIKEANNKVRVGVTCPELTELGINFLQSSDDQTLLLAYPEADMLISGAEQRGHSTSSEWGRGWADPEIRRQRLQRIRNIGTRRKRRRRNNADQSTARGRISTKLAKLNR